ncbi:MAG: peptidylprolyl isomerase [Campylobacterales bacterium]|nr:peptidylprolyl isomerase [Campylobacterales bacterium]
MFKKIISSVVTALLLASSLQGRTIAPDEIKEFSAQVLHIDLNTASKEIQDKIAADYTQRVKLADILVEKLQKDPQFVQLSETFAFDLWSKRIAESVNPTDDELKHVFNESKSMRVPTGYNVRHILVMEETLADDLLKQLNAKTGEDRNRLFSSLALKESLDLKSRQRGGMVGWVDATTVPPVIIDGIKDKEAGTFVKLAMGNNMWEIILVDEINPEHPATFEEAKNSLVIMMRQHAIANEAKRLLTLNEVKHSSSPKSVGKQHK